MTKATILGMIFVCGASTWAGAQVTLDVSKITCDQFSGHRVVNPDKIAIWLSGYYNGKRGNTVIDTQGLDANSKKLLGYCLRNPKTTVMEAVEKVLAPDSH